MSSGESRWGKPPPGYIPGLGRGAVGINTRSDIGPARNIGSKEYLNNKLIFKTSLGQNPKKEQQNQSGQNPNPNPNPESESDKPRDYSDTSYNKWNGYEENLFSNTEYDDEDREADFQYNMVDDYMDERRKSRKEKQEMEFLIKFRNERPTIKQTFSDIKSEMKKMTDDEWDKIPEIGDFTIKKRKIERFTPNTDKNIERGLHDNQLVNAIDPINSINLGMDTPIAEFNNGIESSDILNEVGKAKNSVLSVVFDKMSDKVTGMQSVNPLGYITEMNSAIKINSATEVQDFKKARTILNSILNTDKNNVGGWIAAARLEELDGKLQQARNIISQAALNIFDSEDLWLEAARLHPPQESKKILAQGIKHLTNSKKLWLAAADIEHEKSVRSEILKKALENLPTDEEIWKRAIDLENEEEAKLLLYRAIECIPSNVGMWLALAKLENYTKARNILNKARKAIPTDHSIWVHAAKLEEAQNYNKIESQENDNKIDELIERGIKTLAKNGRIVSTETWYKEAENCERAGSLKVCSAIIKAVIKLDLVVNENDKSLPDEKRQIWLDYADFSKHQGCIETFRFIYDNLIKYAPDDIELWINRINFEKTYGNVKSQDNILKTSVEKCPNNEVLWLMYAKHKWLTDSIQEGKKLLLNALESHPLNEQIVLALVKLEKEDNNFEEAKKILEENRIKINSAKIWMHSIQTLREEKKYEQAFKLCEEAINKFPDFAKLWMIAAQIKIESSEENISNTNIKENLESTVNIYERAIEVNKKNANLYICLSRLLFHKLKREAVARRILEMAIKNLPNNEHIWAENVKFELNCGNFSNANLTLARGLKELPTSGKLWSLAIEMEKQHNKHSKAADALAAVEHNEYIMTSVAKIYVAERNVEKARKWFENSIRVNSDYGDTWVYYYKTELTLGNESKSEEIMRRCEEVKPRHGEIWTSVSKIVENWKMKTKEILLDAIKLI